jgi:tyrosine-protein kinase Etk/Wzc
MKNKSESDLAIAFIKIIIKKVFAFKYVYIASIFIFITIAFFYNKYSSKVYELSALIGPVKDTRSTVLASNDMFRGNVSSYNSGRTIEDAINGFNSFSLISRTVASLNLEVAYFAENNSFIKKSDEIYLQSPFKVNIDKMHIQALGAKYYIHILSDSTFRLSVSNQKTNLYNYVDNEVVAKDFILDIDTICKFNETISNWTYKFSISKNKDTFHRANSEEKLYYFKLYHPEELVKYIMKKLEVKPVSYLASIISVQFSSKNLKISLNFLNSLVNLFLEENLAKKNKIAISTISFIDSQISGMSDSLQVSESNILNFRSDNQAIDINYKGQRSYEQLEQVKAEITNLELQSRYYNYVLNYLNTNQDISGVTPPSTANISDPIMNNLISDLIALYTERSTISNSNEKNLFLVQIDNRIKIQKQTIIENVTNSLNTLNLNLNELHFQSEKLLKEIANLPKKEMSMVNIQRKFDLNNTLYTYLLQKRSESAITLSSNYPDFEILEPAREITSEIIKPKSLMNYMLSLFLGLMLPSMVIIIREILNDNINNINDIEQLLDRLVFGVIYSNPYKYETVVEKSPRSAISESFRNLRSSLFLKLKSEKSKIILTTSSQPQDGKSFISYNLAASIASVGHKTVILDCDLRRPILHDKFHNDNSKGISSFITKNANEDEIILETGVENLFFIPAGPLLPNPSELLSIGVLDNLINSLESKFEYILIDTPPVGLVADSIQLMKYSTLVLMISRNNVTKKDNLATAIAAIESAEIKNYEVILNDLNIESSPYSNYKSYYLKD